MDIRHSDFAAPSSNAASSVVDTSLLVDKWVQVYGTTGSFTASVAIQGRIDTSDSDAWFTIATVTAASITEAPQPFTEMRVVVSGYVTGAIKALLGARKGRV